MKKRLFILILATTVYALGISLFPGNQVVENTTTIKSLKLSQGQIQTPVAVKKGPRVSVNIKNTSPEVLLQDIRKLSQKVFLTSDEKMKLKDLLSSPQLQQNVLSTLKDTANLSAQKLGKRLHSLDVVYEGLKVEDEKLSQEYFAILTDVLLQPADEQVLKDASKREHFNGDRVELVMFASKLNPRIAEALKSDVLFNHPSTKTYFEQAKKLDDLYRVAL